MDSIFELIERKIKETSGVDAVVSGSTFEHESKVYGFYKKNNGEVTVILGFGESPFFKAFETVTINQRLIPRKGKYWSLFTMDFGITKQELVDASETGYFTPCKECGFPCEKDKVCGSCISEIVDKIDKCTKDLKRLLEDGHIEYRDAETVALSLREYFLGDMLDEQAKGLI